MLRQLQRSFRAATRKRKSPKRKKGKSRSKGKSGSYKSASKRALKKGLGARFSAMVTGPSGTKVRRDYEIVRNPSRRIQMRMKGRALSIKRMS